MIELSVIVPVYNVEKYITRCINSILNQSFCNFELILVDDGSTDQSGEICDRFASIDNRIRVIHKPNGGLSDARNVGLDVMKGRYVCFVDSDDWIAEGAFEGLMDALIKNKAQFCVGNMVEIYDDGKIKSEYCPFSKITVMEGTDIFATFNKPNATNRIYVASIFDDLRFPVGKLYEDAFIYHRILAKVNRIVFLGVTTYYYYVRRGSIMHMDYNIRFTDIIDAMNERANWLDSVNQHGIANQTRLFIYSQYAVAAARLKRSDPVQKQRLEEIKKIYNDSYNLLIVDKSLSIKQKMRLSLLRYYPTLHSMLYGKRMPINLS